MYFAVVDQGLVVNTIVLEEGFNWAPPPGCIIVPLSGSAGIGWTWDGTQFVAPPPEPEPVLEEPTTGTGPNVVG
jgi:hypothetical protein